MSLKSSIGCKVADFRSLGGLNVKIGRHPRFSHLTHEWCNCSILKLDHSKSTRSYETRYHLLPHLSAISDFAA